MILFDFFYKKINQLKSILFNFLILRSEFIFKVRSFSKSIESYNLLGFITIFSLLTISIITLTYLGYLAAASFAYVYLNILTFAKSIQRWFNHTELVVNIDEYDLWTGIDVGYAYLDDSYPVALLSNCLNYINKIDHLPDFTILTITIAMFIISRINQRFLKAVKLTLNRTFKSKVYDDKVSVLIAARDEEKNIEECVSSLMKQNYRHYEVLVMDDKSTDATLTILRNLEEKYNEDRATRNKLRIFSNDKPLPKGWYGKSNAIQQLAMQATGKYLMITDADTVHSENSVGYCLHAIKENNVHFLSGFPKQNLDSVGLKILLPSMYIMSSYIIPLWLVDKIQNRNASIAIGQLMVVNKSVFDAVGGLTEVANKICEDLQFARLLKERGYLTKFILLEDFISCNMYESFKDAFLGISKNVFSALDHSLIKYLYTTVVFGAIIHPLIHIVLALMCGGTWTQVAINLCSIIIFSISWSSTLAQHQQSRSTVLWYPCMMFTIFSVSLYSTIIQYCTKGYKWKGRTVQ